MKETCKKCLFNYQSYHCFDCPEYDGKLEDCEKFCKYCTHNYGENACNKCVYYIYGYE